MIYGAILAGGIGERLEFGQPKQFIKINNKPVLIYSVEKFLMIDDFDKIIITVPFHCLEYTKNIISKFFGDNEKLVIIEGGKERNDSILNSIYYLKENNCPKNSILVTHDAARMFVTTELIKNGIKYAKEYGAASAIIPVTDVIFETKEMGKLGGIPLREHLFHSQSPQSFNVDKFLEIYDDLNSDEKNKLYEAMTLFYLRNEKVFLFEGDKRNFKITVPFDIEIAKLIMKKELT